METTNTIRTSGSTFSDPQALATYLSGLTSKGGDRGSISAFGHKPNKGVIALDVVRDDQATYKSLKVGEKKMLEPSAVGANVNRCRAIHFVGTGERRVMLVIADENFLAGENVKQACFTLANVLKKEEKNLVFAFDPNAREEAYLVYTDRQTPIRLTGFTNPVMTNDGAIIAIGAAGALFRLPADKVAKGTVEATHWSLIKMNGYSGPINALALRTQMRDGSEYASGVGGSSFLTVNLGNLAKNEVTVTSFVETKIAENVRPIGAITDTTFAIAERASTDKPWSNVIAVPPAGGVAGLYGSQNR